MAIVRCLSTYIVSDRRRRELNHLGAVAWALRRNGYQLWMKPRGGVLQFHKRMLVIPPRDEMGVFILLSAFAAATLAVVLMEQSVALERRVSRARAIRHGRTIAYVSAVSVTLLWLTYAYTLIRTPFESATTVILINPRVFVPGVFLGAAVITAVASLKFGLAAVAGPRGNSAPDTTRSHLGLIVALVNFTASVITLWLFTQQWLSLRS